MAEGFTEQNAIRTDDTSHAFVTDIFESHYQGRLFDPQEDDGATERLIGVRNVWGNDADPHTTVLTSGVYDLLHLAHMGYLLHVKATGAGAHYNLTHRDDWRDLNPLDKEEFTRWCLNNDKLRLIVSVDGDKSVAARKGHTDPNQSTRPILSWPTRARSVISKTYPTIQGDKTDHLPIVDAVTKHGPADFPAEHTHHHVLPLAEAIQPDTWTIYHESEDLLEAAPLSPYLGEVALLCIRRAPTEKYFTDTFVGDFSTTKLIDRILSGTEE